MQTLRNFRLVRVITLMATLSLIWLQIGPVLAGTVRQSRIDRQTAQMRLEAARRASGLAPGLTQTPDAALRKKIAAKEKAAQEAAIKPIADMRPLSAAEMKTASGRGPLRNPYFNGTLPWQKSFRDVNLCNGNLFKSFTDIQVAPARGAGLVLQRTYNSNDARVGPFGVGWGHAYDIRIQEAAAVQAEDGNATAVSVQPVSGSAQPGGSDTLNEVPRTDFFGAKHTYHRDADGLYSPPPYLYDEMSSDYNSALVNGPVKVDADTEKGMDGTVKHYISVLTLADGTDGNERACDSITDRYGNKTTLTYGQSYTQTDGSTRKLLTQVTDPTNRSLTFQWTNFGTAAQPAYRITEADTPTDLTTGTGAYRVVYTYYGTSDAGAGGASYQLKSVTLDPDGLNRTTTYTYTSFTNSYVDAAGNPQTGTEYGLLASVTDPLGHTISYQYTPWFLQTLDPENYSAGAPMPGTMGIRQVSEPGSGGPIVWNIYPAGNPSSLGGGLTSVVTFNRSDANFTQGTVWKGPDSGTGDFGVAADGSFRVYALEGCPFVSAGEVGGVFSYSTEFSYSYDNDNNMISKCTYSLPSVTPGYEVAQIGYGQQQQNSTYGQHGNVLTQSYTGNPFSNAAPIFDLTHTTYYDASQYFQKASVTDANGHTTAIGVGTNTAGTPGDPDTNIGDRGQTLWVQDAGYNDSTSPSYHRQFTYTYNQYGQKLTETNLNGVVTQYTYGTRGDDLGNLVQVVQDPGDSTHLNRTTTMHYDVMGRVLNSTDPKGQESDFTYNSLGQPLTVTSKALGGNVQETISYVYGANGRTHSVTDNRGTTTIVYEDERYGSVVNYSDRVYSVTDPVTGTISYTYRPFGSRQTMTLPGGQTWTYSYQNNLDGSYNFDNFQYSSDDPDKITERLIKITDDQGRVVEYAPASHGGLRSALSDEVYNSSGMLVSHLQTTTRYYNQSGPNNAPYHYHTDPYGVPWLDQTQTAWYGQNANQQSIQRIVSENDYTYDNVGQRLTNTIGSQAVNADGSGQVNGSGNPIWQSQRTEAYTYDALNRLSTVNYGDGQTQGYTFDAMGNRLGKTDSVAGATSYDYDAANRLMLATGAGGDRYASDADGNTTTSGTRTNVWDSQNRLVSCTSGGLTSTYTYGADGLRRSATVNGKTTYYVYDGTMLVREMQQNAQGVLQSMATYLCGPRGPEYRRDDTQAEGTYTDSGGVQHPAGKTRWYVFDGLGSVVGEVDPSGNLTSSGTFDVYGAKRQGGTGAATSRQGFVGSLGHVSDAETGLVYMRARYYDPNVGRFVSEDRKRNGSNWFVYANSSPTNNVDADGNEPFSIAIQSANLWQELWAAAEEGATVGDLLQMFAGDVYFAAGSMGALDLRIISGIFRFDAPLDEVLKTIGDGIEYDHFPDLFKADEGGINALARMGGEGELLDMESGEAMAVLTEL